VPARELQVIAQSERQLAQQLMGLNKIAAAADKPAQLVGRQLQLAPFDHGANFVQVLGPVASTSRVDEQPASPVGGATYVETAFRPGRAAGRFALSQLDLSQ
jgi:hypothetical protein